MRSGGKMAFEWHRIHKWEDNIESQVTDSVYEYVLEYYGVEEITDLTQEQIEEISGFREELNDYSPMQWGFSNLVNNWENEQYEDD
tara:strand:+ start:73 stop:330 length:258 start_codon:yes stop_codon:yes gene_type:complete